MEQTQIVQGLADERALLAAYLTSLQPEQWSAASLCDGWTVKDVVSHVVGNVTDVLDGRLDGVGSDAYNQRQVDERAGRAPAELLAEWENGGPAVEGFYASLTAEQWAQEMGRFGTLGDAVQRHLYDLWVHAQDIRVALGDPPSDGTGARASLEVIARDVRVRVKRMTSGIGRVTLDDGTAPVTLDAGDEGAHVTVRASAPVLVMMATGRVPLADAVAGGDATVDPAASDDFAHAFNIYGAPPA